MDVHARPAALPEVPALLNTFQVRFRRPEGGHALARYMTGRLTELPNKNGETMAQAIPAQRPALAGVPHEQAMGRRRPEPPTGAEADGGGDAGGRGGGGG